MSNNQDGTHGRTGSSTTPAQRSRSSSQTRPPSTLPTITYTAPPAPSIRARSRSRSISPFSRAPISPTTQASTPPSLGPGAHNRTSWATADSQATTAVSGWSRSRAASSVLSDVMPVPSATPVPMRSRGSLFGMSAFGSPIRSAFGAWPTFGSLDAGLGDIYGGPETETGGGGGGAGTNLQVLEGREVRGRSTSDGGTAAGGGGGSVRGKVARRKSG